MFTYVNITNFLNPTTKPAQFYPHPAAVVVAAAVDEAHLLRKRTEFSEQFAGALAEARKR